MFVPTLLEEPLTIAAIVVILVQSVVLDFVWKRSRGEPPEALAPSTPA